ncbi:hypothetical protein C8F01DRAFT_1143837 [Mycena amicta]|nr:hypothetical protein C8F01DRAFT_1143837 [Mycena amicta]
MSQAPLRDVIPASVSPSAFLALFTPIHIHITTNTTIHPLQTTTMLCSTRAIVPPNGFLPFGGRSVALIANIVPVLRTTKAEPLRRQRAQQGSPSMDACSPHVAQMKALGGVPLCRQRAHRGISSESSCPFDSAVQAKLLPVGGVPMCRQRAHRGSDTYAS